MPNLSPRSQGLIAINIAAIIFGSAALFGKLDVSPFWIVAARSGFAAITLALLAIVRKEMQVPPRHAWATIGITGIILALHWLTFFKSVQMSSVAVATLTFAAFPFFTVLMEAYLQRRKPHRDEVIAGLAIIIAVGLLVHPQEGHGGILGIVLGLISAFTFAIFGHTSKRLGKILSPLHISLVQNIVVCAVLLPFLFTALPYPHHPSDWFWLIMLGVVTTALMHQLYFYALRRLSASTCSGFVALEPVYAILFAAWVFHESLTLWVIISGALIVVSSLALLRLEARHAP